MDVNISRFQANPCTSCISRRTAFGSLAGGMALATVGRVHALAQATPARQGPEGETPNHFELDGAETRIIYDLSAAAGGPRLAYDGSYGSQTFAGGAIITEECALGQLVTGDLGAFPDQGQLWLTLLLPRFNPMASEDDPAPFSTLAILKWSISTIAGPPRTGALEEYRVLPLEGTARRIVS